MNYKDEMLTVNKSKLKLFYKDWEKQKNLAKHTQALNETLLKVFRVTDKLQQSNVHLFKLCKNQNRIISILIDRLIEKDAISMNRDSRIDWHNFMNDDIMQMNKKIIEVEKFLLENKEFKFMERAKVIAEERDKCRENLESIQKSFKKQTQRYILLKDDCQSYKDKVDALSKELKEYKEKTSNKEQQFFSINQPKLENDVKCLKFTGSPIHGLLSSKSRQDPDGREIETVTCAYCPMRHLVADFENHKSICPGRNSKS